MNDKIKELYDLAVVAAGKDKPFETTNLDVAAKLVELVVRECADLIDNVLDPGSPPNLSLGEQLLENFGIEEYQPPVYETHCPHGILIEKYCKNCDIEVAEQLGVE